MKRGHMVLAVIASVVGGSIAPPVVRAAELTDSVVARFGTKSIDIATGWGDANACVELGATVECFRSERDLDRAHPELATAQSMSIEGSPTIASGLAPCSSSLRLYNGTSYSGSVLILTTRGTALNLSSFGFDNVTSSYKVGACSTSFYSAASLGGSLYSGPTGANSSAASMASGWDNVVSSVWIA